jgi:hypothetical protein
MDALLGSIPAPIAGVGYCGPPLKSATVSTDPHGCPTFAPAYVGRKRWAKPFDGPLFRTLPFVMSTETQAQWRLRL